MQQDENIVYSSEYKLIDIGVLITYFGGALSLIWVNLFTEGKLFWGVFWMIVSLLVLMIGRFIALKAAFERENENE